jgi:hypothetical protein
MNESQQVASLAGIPMDQVKEFARQYIELAMMTNTITMWISGIVFLLCVLGLINAFGSKYVNESLGKFCFSAGLIAGIIFASASWDRYKMTHYPIPYIIQDLRSSNK